MAGESTARTALLSIQPRFAQKILAGSKTVEFRRRGFAHPVDHVVVYASSPLQLVLGYFEVDEIVVDHPRRLWSRVGARGGITRPEFDAYYAGVSVGAAILVGKLWRLRSPIPLARLGVPSLSPPQSYRYLPQKSVKRLRVLAD